MNDIFASLRQGAPAVPTKKRDEMRRIIMDATMKLINERDVCDIKPSDIMKITGLSRAAFYYHFPDIPSILLELYQRDAMPMGNTITDTNNNAAQVITNVVNYFIKFGRLERAILLYAGRHRTIYDFMNARISWRINQIATIIKRDQAAGLARPDLDPIEAAAMSHFAVSGYLTWHFGRSDNPISPEKAIRHIMLTVVHDIYPNISASPSQPA